MASGLRGVAGTLGAIGPGAAVKHHRTRAVAVAAAGRAGAPYVPGLLLALREGPLRAAAYRRLPARPEVLLVDATGRDHPRGVGLALHLGVVLDVPTVGVTDRPLAAVGDVPDGERGARAPLWLDGEVVGFLVRTRNRCAAGRRPCGLAHCAGGRSRDRHRRCAERAHPAAAARGAPARPPHPLPGGGIGRWLANLPANQAVLAESDRSRPPHRAQPARNGPRVKAGKTNPF